MQKVQFEYFHNDDSDQYSFYRIPKLLFTEEYFSSLSCEAKVLYGLMLDRMSLSLKNKWFDEQNRAYIIFTIEDINEQNKRYRFGYTKSDKKLWELYKRNKFFYASNDLGSLLENYVKQCLKL